MASQIPPPLPYATSPVLGYAGPFLTEERLPQAEALILADVPMTHDGMRREYERLFSSVSLAAAYYSRFQNQRFTPENLDGICKDCGQRTDCAVGIEWSIQFRPRPGTFVIAMSQGRAEMRTFHSLCDSCLRDLRRRRRAIWLMIGIPMIPAAALFYILGVAMNHATPEVVVDSIVETAALAALVYWIASRFWSNHLPPALGRIIGDAIARVERLR